MRIFVFGANGMLGNYVTSYLSKYYQIFKLNRTDYDISQINTESLMLFLKSRIESNDIIINCAGVIPQRSKSNKREFYLVNTLFPVILSVFCEQKGIKFIHITTDCVFSGSEGNYNELSIPDEENDYGISKSLSDLSFGTIIRTSIIGEEFNSKRSLLEWLKSNKDKTVYGYDDHYWNGVTCLELSKIIYRIISENRFWIGVRHVFSPNVVTKYKLLEMINEIYQLNINIIKTDNGYCNKTLSSIYDLNFDVPELFQQIEELKEFKFS